MHHHPAAAAEPPLQALSKQLQPLGLAHLADAHVLHPGQRREQLLRALLTRSVGGSRLAGEWDTVPPHTQQPPCQPHVCDRVRRWLATTPHRRRLLGGASVDAISVDSSAEALEGLAQDERFAESECSCMAAAL
jgi:hypothetical protein